MKRRQGQRGQGRVRKSDGYGRIRSVSFRREVDAEIVETARERGLSLMDSIRLVVDRGLEAMRKAG